MVALSTAARMVPQALLTWTTTPVAPGQAARIAPSICGGEKSTPRAGIGSAIGVPFGGHCASSSRDRAGAFSSTPSIPRRDASRTRSSLPVAFFGRSSM